MMRAARTPHPCMLEAIGRLRALGYKVAALTNNFQVPEDDQTLDKVGGAASTVLPSLFDVFVESSVVGMRKPDPRVFQLTLERLGLPASQVAFLDDLGVYGWQPPRWPRGWSVMLTRAFASMNATGRRNVKAARQLGMHTIRVELNKSKEALWALERLLGVELIQERPPAPARL